MTQLGNILPELSELLKDSSQNTILFFLYAVGCICKHLPKKWIDNGNIPAVICVASFIVTPMWISPFRDAFTYAPMFAAIELIAYKAGGKRVEDWIKEKFRVLLGMPSPQVQERPFKEPANSVKTDSTHF